MIHSARTFLAWKEGDEQEDCQDSIHPTPDAPSENGNCFAVADGATRSFFGGDWARILTTHFARQPEDAFEDWHNWLKDAQNEWRKKVEEKARSEKADFFTLNRLYRKDAAAAAFVGLTIAQSSVGHWNWRAIILGDSCLFRLTGNGELHSRNIKSSQDFSSVVEAAESWPKSESCRPALVGSPPYGNEQPIGGGDSLILTTDALAKWLLSRHEAGEPVWGTLLSLGLVKDFQSFVSDARIEAEGALENDDIALAVINFGETQQFLLGQIFIPKPRSRTTLDALVASREPLGISRQPTDSFRNAHVHELLTGGIAFFLRKRRAVFVVIFGAIVFGLSALLLREIIRHQSDLRELRSDNDTLRVRLNAVQNEKRASDLDKIWIEKLADHGLAPEDYLQDLRLPVAETRPTRKLVTEPSPTH